MISVIIPNYNGKEHLQVCLTSLFAQQEAGEFEVIVVDNGSTDGSALYMEANFPSARVIKLSSNSGFARACNIGFHSSLGDLVSFLNNDTEVKSDWLKELNRAALAHHGAGFFASKMMFFAERNRIDSAGDDFSGLGHGIKRGHGKIDTGQFDREEEIFGACGGAAMFRRNVFRDAGGFDEKFFAYCEDVDLNFRLKKAGHKCFFVPSAVVYHKLGGTAKIMSGTHVYYTQRNQEIVLLKHAPAKTRLIHFFYNIYSFFRHLFRGRAAEFLRAKLDALKMFKEYSGEIQLAAVTESGKAGKDDTDLLVGKLDTTSYQDFFITPENRDALLGFLERSGLKEKVIKAAEATLDTAEAKTAGGLLTIAKAYWLTKDRKFLNCYIRELNRLLDEFTANALNIFNTVYGYYFIAGAELPYELKRKYVQRMKAVSDDPAVEDEKSPEFYRNQAAVFMLSLSYPFILKYPYNDNFEKLIAMLPAEGILDRNRTQLSAEAYEAVTIYYLLLKSRRKVEEKAFFFKKRRLYEFCLTYAKPDGKFPVEPKSMLTGKSFGFEYLLYLKFLAENDWDNMKGGIFSEEYLFLGGAFSEEVKELEPPKYKPETASSGFPSNKIYIMKHGADYLFTDILGLEFLPGGYPFSTRADRNLILDDNLIVYDRKAQTNLWAAGREFDILDVQYEVTPSVLHRRQIYYNKKGSFWVIRDRLLGMEQHNVKIYFYPGIPGAFTELEGSLSKAAVRECINKFMKANKVDGTLLKLGAEQELGFSAGGEFVLVPLNNPGLTRVKEEKRAGYHASVVLSNEFIFLIAKNNIREKI